MNTKLHSAININDSVTKSKFDNKYGWMMVSNEELIMIAGKTVVIVDMVMSVNCAQSMSGYGAQVVVTEISHKCLQAAMKVLKFQPWMSWGYFCYHNRVKM